MSRDAFDRFNPPDRSRFGDNESSVRGNDSVRSDLIDLPLALHHETPARGGNEGAVLVSIDGDENKAQWIPKARCEVELNPSFVQGRRKSGSLVTLKSVTVTLSEKLAVEKRLV